MNRLLLILILTFSFQTLTKADDIRDFQIEGMSIGDSALEHYSMKLIKLANKYNCENSAWKNCEMFSALMGPKGIYTSNIQLHFKKDDLNYIIYGITGTVKYVNNINDCYLKQKEIGFELETLFPNTNKKEIEKAHSADKTGNSRNNSIYFKFLNNEIVYVACYDWSKKMKYNDHLRIAILSAKYNNWLSDKAYK